MSDVTRIKNENTNLTNEISILKKKLLEINTKKEQCYKKKETFKKDISSLIANIKTIKLNDDKSNILITNLKQERDKYNSNMKDLVGKLKKLNKEKQEIFQKYKLKEDPYKIQKRIEGIEKKLEIETSFENEKKLMKQLNELKKIFRGSKINELFLKIEEVNKELDVTRIKSNDFHNKLNEVIKGKNGYAEFMETSKKINDLRKLQEEAFNNFINYKREFIILNNNLKEKLKQVSETNQKVIHENNISQQKIRTIIKQKTQNVLEKFKKKKKLTTEDLIILQGDK